MFSHIVGDTPEQQAVIDEIMRRGEEERRQIARENLLDNTRIAGGALLSGASALPIFNIPYIGTGIGGAMEGAGNAIMQGKSGKDIATDAGIGFVIGETIGAIPYAGKFAGKTKAGQAVANKASGMYNKLMASDAGIKVANALDTDVEKFTTPLYRKIKFAKATGTSPFAKGTSARADDIAGNNTPLTETQAFKNWSGDTPMVLSKDALDYPFKTGQGVTLEGYHGTARGDRVGSEFRKDRATSGPMAFFSSNKEVAEGYARNKADTSLAEEMSDYGNWFKYRDANGNLKPLSDAWYDLTPEERLAVSKNAPHITYDENAENIIFNPDVNYGTGNYDYAIKSNKNNHIKALIDEWLNSGNLYGNEGDFAKVLEKSGINMKNIDYIDPYADYSKVYDVFLSMKNPLVTNDIPTNIVEQLAKEAPNHPASGYGVDLWDKNVMDGNRWIAKLQEDLAEGKNSNAWTSIPDWVTEKLEKSGYDGIIDMGGKSGGEIHRVYIPFEPTQIKSVNNQGTFDPTNPNIYKSVLGGLGLYELLRGKTPNEQVK